MKFAKILAYVFLAGAIVYVSAQIILAVMGTPRIDQAFPQYTISPKNADVTVVEFLNYTCPYCREVHPAIMEAVRRDGRVRYIPRPVPSDGMTSVPMSILTYAGGAQGKFFETHNAQMNNFQVVYDELYLKNIAQIAGLDYQKLAEDMYDPTIGVHLEDNITLFNDLNLKRTPTFIINGEVFVPEGSLPDADGFLKIFQNARAKKQLMP